MTVTIDYGRAVEYWSGVSSNINGMLGGHTKVHKQDVQQSTLFIKQINQQRQASTRLCADCGSGIGRVTMHVLASIYSQIEMVEPVVKFLDDAREEPALATKVAAGEIVQTAVGLQDWTGLPQASYDLIWIQWAASQIKDDDLVAFLQRAKSRLSPNGWIGMKENVAHPSCEYVMDEEDSSVTRNEAVFTRLIERAGLALIQTEAQHGWPSDLFGVKMSSSLLSSQVRSRLTGSIRFAMA